MIILLVVDGDSGGEGGGGPEKGARCQYTCVKAFCFTIVNSVAPEILLKNAVSSWSSFFLGTVWPQRTETTQTVDYN